MTSTKVLSNHVTLVPRQKLHPHVQEFQEFEVRSLENLVSLIMEKFQSIQDPNFNSYDL